MCSYYFAALDILLVIFIKLRYSFNSFFFKILKLKMHFETEKTYFRRIFVTFYKFLNSLFEGITFEREMSQATFVTLLLKFDVVDFTAFMSAFDHRVNSY